MEVYRNNFEEVSRVYVRHYLPNRTFYNSDGYDRFYVRQPHEVVVGANGELYFQISKE